MKKLFLLFLSMYFLNACSDDSPLSGPIDNGGSALSGSYANMLVVNPYLYIVSNDELITYNIQDEENPVELDRQNLGFGVESIFHRSGVLFIGSRTNLYIFSINAIGIPEEQSRTPYTNLDGVQPCDPVIADETIAYVTLSSTLADEDGCGSSDVNELRLYDIVNIQNPTLISRTSMNSPKGLGLDQSILFVCEATSGLKIFDVSDPQNLVQLYHFNGFAATDVIVTNGLALVVGPENLYEYDYSDIDNVVLASTIEL